MKKVTLEIESIRKFKHKDAANIFIQMKLHEAGFDKSRPHKFTLDPHNYKLAVYTQED